MKSLKMIIKLSALIMSFASLAMADGPNIALGQPGTASGMYAPYIIENAFDGDEETYWNAGGYGGHWIEVDLGADTIIGSMRMKAAMSPNGGTTQVITGRTESGDTVTLWSFAGYTTNGQWLENLSIEIPTAVRYVRVTTPSTPSWVAWSEIEVFEGSTVPTDDLSWSAFKAMYRSE